MKIREIFTRQTKTAGGSGGEGGFKATQDKRHEGVCLEQLPLELSLVRSPFLSLLCPRRSVASDELALLQVFLCVFTKSSPRRGAAILQALWLVRAPLRSRWRVGRARPCKRKRNRKRVVSVEWESCAHHSTIGMEAFPPRVEMPQICCGQVVTSS